MEENELCVIMWSFCASCGGNGCNYCKKAGTTISIHPLGELKGEIRRIYQGAQKDLLEMQRGGKTIHEVISSTPRLKNLTIRQVEMPSANGKHVTYIKGDTPW